ncbi:Pycsar system effector family protein [Nocardiopsis lambiniae]|uniref:DUF5706 domain-containing protein n=1 Tax=Nocardiopsis lambiniae TaxID=3075539 RepID=A0ABU2MGA2_9ACTN|nr:Pycsar system effector family protein [Nocardiopsis sp. DSM 44743]MDT0331733.1 DUF5706 domain-containing protein [Nocardiopsis sp. DSM 44743]
MSSWNAFLLRLADRDGPGEGGEERTRTYALGLLADTREEIVRADQKAAILSAAMGVAIGAVLGPLLSDVDLTEGLPLPWRALWWTGAATALAGIGCFGAAVFPRIRGPRTPAGAVGFYGDVVAHPDDVSLREGLTASAELELDRVVSQLREVSRIVVLKYLLLRAGILLSGASTVCLIGVLVARHLR